jgi:hypothetical protein
VHRSSGIPCFLSSRENVDANLGQIVPREGKVMFAAIPELCAAPMPRLRQINPSGNFSLNTSGKSVV